MSIVYCIMSLANRVIYIGSTDDIEKEQLNQEMLLNSGSHFNSELQDEWNRFGKDDFEFFVMEKTYDMFDHQKEDYWMTYFSKVKGFKARYVNDRVNGAMAWSKISEQYDQEV